MSKTVLIVTEASVMKCVTDASVMAASRMVKPKSLIPAESCYGKIRNQISCIKSMSCIHYGIPAYVYLFRNAASAFRKEGLVSRNLATGGSPNE